MTEFASRFNSPAEQRALIVAIVEAFGAVEVSGSGLDRARVYAERAELSEPGTKPVGAIAASGIQSARRVAAEAPGSESSQPELWDT